MKAEATTLSRQGDRPYMEDRFFLDLNFAGRGELFAVVYDGHGGYKAAEYAARELHLKFSQLLAQMEPQDAFVRAYEAISAEITSDMGGACAVTIYKRGSELFYANAGDCRILIIGEECTQLTKDHHVDDPEERARIVNAKGIIRGPYVFVGFSGVKITRSLGDQVHKPYGVIASPEVGLYRLSGKERFAIVASDGLFEKLTNEAIFKIALVSKSASELADRLRGAVEKAQTKDNTTAIVLDFTSTLYG